MRAQKEVRYVRTGTAAKALGFSPHIVRRLLDLQELRAVEVPGHLPAAEGRGQRLVEVDSLFSYAEKHGIELDTEVLP